MEQSEYPDQEPESSNQSDASNNAIPENALPKEGPKGWTRMPDGRLVNIFDLIKKEGAYGEQSLSLSLLNPGDMLALQFTGEDGGSSEILFQVHGTEVRHAGINVGAPEQIPSGVLSGFLPREVTGQSFCLVGTRLGRHYQQFGILNPGGAAFFVSDAGEYATGTIDKFGVYRLDSTGELHLVPPENLGSPSPELTKTHQERIARVKDLLSAVGFAVDYQDCSQTQEERRYEDNQYIIEYTGGMALGNRLAIYDKTTSQWMECSFINFQGENALKVSFADLTGLDLKKVFIVGSIFYDSGVRNTDRSITTFVTSPASSLDLIDYVPSQVDLGKIGITDYPNRSDFLPPKKPAPDIVIHSDGRFTIDHYGFYTPIETSHPGALKAIRDAVTVESADGKMHLAFNSHPIADMDPDVAIEQVIANIRASSFVPEPRLSLAVDFRPAIFEETALEDTTIPSFQPDRSIQAATSLSSKLKRVRSTLTRFFRK